MPPQRVTSARRKPRLACPVKARVRASLIIEGQVVCEGGARFADAVVGFQVDLLVFDAAPQALDEHVVAPGAFAVHADRDAVIQQHAGVGDAGELAAPDALRSSSGDSRGVDLPASRHRRLSNRAQRPFRPQTNGRAWW